MPLRDDTGLDWPTTEGDDAQLLRRAACAFSIHSLPALVGLAVSGGSDSMAMLHLMARAAPHAGWQVRAVTVDHALRPEAADEARLVGRVCATLGVPHDILVWDHGVVAGNLMDAARRARYDLIADWARGHGIGQIALAHSATDQAETFLMGLARAAGLDGLSGMRRRFTHKEVMFRRPFLLHTRADLRAYLTRHDLAWIEDPTNENNLYTRTKARRALKALSPLGITEARLAATVDHLAMAQRVLRRATIEAAEAVVSEVAGSLQMSREKFSRLDPELKRRVVILCLLWLTGDDYPPRATGIDRLVRAIFFFGKDATLAGCRVKLRGDQVALTREPRMVGSAVALGALWDGRWKVDGPLAPDIEIRALGEAGLAACKDWRDLGLPREVLLVTPALWQGAHLVAAPAVRPGSEWTAAVSQSFIQFILSH